MPQEGCARPLIVALIVNQIAEHPQGIRRALFECIRRALAKESGPEWIA